MSSQDYNKKIDEGKKLANSIRKDIKNRHQKQKRDESLFDVDSEIRGSLVQLTDIYDRAEFMFKNFQANTKDFGFSNKQLQKKRQQLEELDTERLNVKKQFESCFEKKQSAPQVKVATNQPDFSQMNKKQLIDHKQKQQKQQDQLLDQAINIVKGTKKGGENISKQLDVHDVLLDKLDTGMDQNIQKIGKVRRNMTKLLQSSSYCCLIFIIILEIAGLVCNGIFWK